MNSKFTQQEREKFLRDLAAQPLQSDSEFEDSFYERQSKRMQAQIAEIRKQKDLSILQQLKRNVKEEDEMMTEYEKEREELHKITSNEQKNVIAPTLIQAIKEKVATNINNSKLVLADQEYNQSVLAQQTHIQEAITKNKSFLKIKAASEQKIQKMQVEEAFIARKIEIASQQRQQLAMEQEDKLSYKYQMQCLSDLFKERFLVPKFPAVKEQTAPIKLVFTRLPSSLIRLTPQEVSQETVLPRNAPEIALKQLKKNRRANLKHSKLIQVKVTPKKISRNNEKFQQVDKDHSNPEDKNSKIDLMFTEYIRTVKPLVGIIQGIAAEYRPRFLRYLKQEQKNLNYELESNVGSQKNITHVASLQNANSLCELKLSFQKLTALTGIQHFANLQEVQFQFNLISSIEPLKNCHKLIQLNLSHNKIKNINSISNLAWLRLLNVQHNLLQTLVPGCKALEVIIASHNRIQKIELRQTKQLRILQLQYNRLHDLPQLQLFGLEELGLGHNQLTDLKGTEELLLLKKLDVSHNRIGSIDRICFLYLNELNLCSNGLSSLNDLFLPCLQGLRLSDNKLAGKGTGVAFLPNLKEINLDDNRLEGFGCVWWLLRFAKGAEVIRYGNNQYFLGLREKVREVYESLLYKSFPALKILNDAPADRGLAQYYKENYGIFFDGSTFFQESGPSLIKIEAIVRLLLRESTFSRVLQSKNDPFSRQQAYIDYQWRSKVACLNQVIKLSQKNHNAVIISPTLFNRYDNHQLLVRNLYHCLRGALLGRVMRRKRKQKHYMKLKPQIASLLEVLSTEHVRYEVVKSISHFGLLLKGLNQNQAAIKIQKVWRGYIRRKIYRKLLSNKNKGDDSDFEDVDVDFFNNEIERVEFEIDLEGFEDIIIRPEVFTMLEAKQKQSASKPHKGGIKEPKNEQKGPLMNNFLDSRTKLSQPGKPPQREEEENEAEKLMREWKIKDPRVLKALQFKQQKKQQMKKKEIQKNMTAAQRYERFKRGGY